MLPLRKPISKAVGHTMAISHISWDAVGIRCYSCDVDGNVKVWKVEELVIPEELTNLTSMDSIVRPTAKIECLSSINQAEVPDVIELSAKI
jgi:WD40 repeat protein